MEWSSAQTWEATEPGWPIVVLAATLGANTLFKVHSIAGAVIVAAVIALVLFAVTFLLQRNRARKLSAGPVSNPWQLPWGGLFVVVGGVMLTRAEPWKYYGFGILVLGGLDIIFGAIAYARQPRR